MNDPQVDFYRKVLGALEGRRIKRAGVTKSEQSFFIVMEDGEELIFYARCGDMFYPVELQAKKGKSR